MIYYNVVDVLQVKVRLRYRLSFVQNGQELTEIGEASDIPNS